METINRDAWKFCVAPMLGVTNRHCRFLYRCLNSHIRLYTEMVTTAALMRSKDIFHRYLDFDESQHPVVLQIGGNNPFDLAKSARIGESCGYDEININCGCPSRRVVSGSFGACLMKDVDLVSDCLKAIMDSVSIPVSIKHRIGIDNVDSYQFVRDFVGEIHNTGCKIFIVHARNAILNGLSPKKNRDIPILKYDYVYNLKKDFPDAVIILNGGISGISSVKNVENFVDGVMIGRYIMSNPLFLLDIGSIFYKENKVNYDNLINNLIKYADRETSNGVPLRVIVKPMLNLFKGTTGAGLWRRMLSNTVSLSKNDPGLISMAWDAIGDKTVIL
ncbi:tRNA-dihydrouridine synthase A [Candidatus Kinetoplastibacterium blastocrithidii TCC012E]|uniref:tRNA-dihydrouridine(20/20a) synthase n=1 Tax=Candidatus Kinetoplastidibacterium blastocrithidiae TCC012E TaxID=1208922 RepID=M1M018_9PROT|nr:tRNA dihydrouridine(20/20a) synthase DusA [Candidatus Kinetoplastibacterium blastocrithidii]AGF49651.1 tRNA-dihydrouridine synthase A [Candidatus Kinetoplastibacterium blastocrithidii TCC012E]